MIFSLSSDQVEAIQGILSVVDNTPFNSSAACVLKGCAGSGKTTVVYTLLNALIQKGRSYRLAATTHRAAEVLQNSTGEVVYTIHKLMGLRPSINKAGVETIKRTIKNLRLPMGTVIIIDESSMVSLPMLKVLANIAKEYGLILVFVGDGYQLPPTKGKCPIFDGSLPTFELTSIHRQSSGNPILALADQYRRYMDKELSVEPNVSTMLNSAGHGVHALNNQEFIQKFVDNFLEYNTGDRIESPMCVYTNKRAIYYNNLIRKSQYFLEGQIMPYYPGELLISNSAVIVDNLTIISNNEECIVVDYAPIKITEEIPGYLLTLVKKDHFDTASSNEYKIKVVASADGMKKYKDILSSKVKSLEKNYHWNHYYADLNKLGDLRPPFAGTTHKAQGGTFPNVFIDMADIRTCRNPLTRAKLMYVALTRAKDSAYVLI